MQKDSMYAVLNALANDAHLTIAEICKVTGLRDHTVERRLRMLHWEPRKVYIWDWTRNAAGRRGDAIWALGDDEDAEEICSRNIAPDLSAVDALRTAYRSLSSWDPFLVCKWNVAQVSGERG